MAGKFDPKIFYEAHAGAMVEADFVYKAGKSVAHYDTLGRLLSRALDPAHGVKHLQWIICDAGLGRDRLESADAAALLRWFNSASCKP